MRLPGRARWLGLAAAALLTTAAVPLVRPPAARACGIFPRTIAPEERPTLSREKVIIVHDAEQGVEHFIREVVFDRAAEPLGFVVPTPSRPSVHGMKQTPFTALRQAFPFLLQLGLPRGGAGVSGYGKGAGGSGPGVAVLEKKRVGSFEAFVLAADDETALTKWLEDNDFETPPEAQTWLKHYVDLGFHYVALRFDPPKRRAKDQTQAQTLDAETIRISFDAPLPYYPYLEPEAPALPGGAPRLLEVWYVGAEPMVPVAVLDEEGGQSWVRPLRGGERYADARASLLNAAQAQLGPLLPEGPLQLQTFQDQKRRRDGFGDIVFVPEEAKPLTPERREALGVFVSLLDPSLAPPKTEVSE